MKYTKISALIASILLAGCATDKARNYDGANYAAYLAAYKQAQLVSESATLDRADAAKQTISLTDSGGNPIEVAFQGNYEVAKVPIILKQESEVIAQLEAQSKLGVAGIGFAGTALNAWVSHDNNLHSVESNERLGRLRIESNERIETSQNDLIASLAAPSVSTETTDYELSDYPCPISTDAGDYVPGSVDDGWAEGPGYGNCVEIEITEDADEEVIE